MPISLFPLTIKAPGILRDPYTGDPLKEKKPNDPLERKLFQGESCTDSNWIRFYKGKPKKIGGQLALVRSTADDPVPQNATLVTSVWLGGFINYVVVTPTGIYTNRIDSGNPNIFTEEWIRKVTFDDAEAHQNILWQAEVVTTINRNEAGEPLGGAATHIVLFGGYNKNEINSVTAALLYNVSTEGERITTVKTFNPNSGGIGIPEDLVRKGMINLNGGTVFVGNLLFIYGTKGTVMWSRQDDAFRFIGEASGQINISNDKVIYARGVRGGNNPPTVLFWTMNSVVRVSNQTNSSEIGKKPDFQVDIITTESSVLSSRSIVEYDGMFFWLGIDRIFLYNGVVREVVNNTNFDWFFANLDTKRRQQVFGIKNSEKGEIWWYFPRLDTEGENSHALIYNIRENVWYDTPISRTCGFHDGSSGKMITYGKALVPALIDPDFKNIWIHEEDMDQQNNIKVGNVLVDVRTPITSSFTTPIISLTAFPPGEGSPPDDKLISIERIEADFNLKDGATINMKINARYYGDNIDKVIFEDTIKAGVGKNDIRCQGRNVSFTFTTTDDFALGTTLIGVKVGDGR